MVIKATKKQIGQGAAAVKNPPPMQETRAHAGSIPGQGRSCGEGNGNQLQYSYLENPIDRGAWWTTVHAVTKEVDTT